MERKTPLYDIHVQHGGKMVEYAGYKLPVQYEGIKKEHMTVRSAAGLFDASHMGEFLLTGADALANIQKLVTNDCATMVPGQVKYSPLCYADGGVVDDLLVYKKGQDSYMLVVNASNHNKDWDWISQNISGDVQLEGISDQTALLALQGPNAEKIITKLTTSEIPSKNYTFIDNADFGGIFGILSRTGYTGEDGFEIYASPKDAPELWKKIILAGEEYGIAPCGLGARDTLRLEAAMPLYGHEISEKITPLEAGLKFFVKMNKDFIGKEGLTQKAEPKVKRIGIALKGRGIAREGDRVFCEGEDIGRVTSGTLCPYINQAVAMALVNIEHGSVGEVLTIENRGKMIECEVVKLPFYRRK